MRLFTAIEPPAVMRQALSRICYGVPRTRWMPAEQLHLTLVFIGEVQPGLLPTIIDTLAGVQFQPFRLSCQGVGSFRSGVLWLAVDASPPLLALQQRIDRRLRHIEGLKLESRRYQPHLTLGRMPRQRRPDLSGFIAEHQSQRFSFAVDAFQLKSSLLSARGALHCLESEFIAIA